jgi:hypothetical protein
MPPALRQRRAYRRRAADGNPADILIQRRMLQARLVPRQF